MPFIHKFNRLNVFNFSQYTSSKILSTVYAIAFWCLSIRAVSSLERHH